MKTNIIISKRKYAVFAFLFLNSILVLHAGKKVDFSGNWILNEEKSELGERSWADINKNIKQEDNKLVVERKFTGRNGEEMTATDTYTLDGKESVNEGFGNSERKSTATWSEDGKTLTIKSSVSFDRNGENRVFENTEIWMLSDDGKTLIITSKNERGERKMVYDLQKTK
jgi:hypothetical protein